MRFHPDRMVQIHRTDYPDGGHIPPHDVPAEEELEELREWAEQAQEEWAERMKQNPLGGGRP